MCKICSYTCDSQLSYAFANIIQVELIETNEKLPESKLNIDFQAIAAGSTAEPSTNASYEPSYEPSLIGPGGEQSYEPSLVGDFASTPAPEPTTRPAKPAL